MRSGVDELLEFGFMSVWLAKWSTIMAWVLVNYQVFLASKFG